MEDRVKERAERTAERYASKLLAGSGGRRRDGNFQAQAERYALGVARTTRLRADAGAELDTFGVPTIMRPFYYSFALRLDKLCREELSESSLWTEGHILVSTWMARGLRRDVLLSIALDLFNLNLARSEPPTGATAADGVESDRG